ncbi:hypothetical protein NAP1_10443 [Erythrobacter sp. NAP1]|uniref:hypothetical protein n=1 Tax=Erythrobacter sp. NAP1 TaxID=237727 RepID=UPI000068786B|nr:hypothetical protein [Erythrobacter sp. NAP1]EAQ28006.1 hypothetical protein NAP1_10443 [Erythrobacter sp. NAP1]
MPGHALAQANPNDVPRDESAFVNQAPERSSQVEPVAQPVQQIGSPVYFPDQITPQSVAEARARAAQEEEFARQRAAAAQGELAQVSRGEGARDVDQLSDGQSAEALAQLSPAERQVLLEAVEGTDICEQANNIEAIRALCEDRIETRSAEFGQRRTASAEDTLLGGRFDSDRIATLESAISRLAQNTGRAQNFSDQAVASVALSQQTLSDAQATAAEGDGVDGLSPETQAVVNAIVTQLGGN